MVKVIQKDYDENDQIFLSGPQTFVSAPRPSTKPALTQETETETEDDGIQDGSLAPVDGPPPAEDAPRLLTLSSRSLRLFSVSVASSLLFYHFL